MYSYVCTFTCCSGVSRVGGAGSWFRSPCLVVSGQDASGPYVGWLHAYVRDGNGAFRKPKFECGCCEMLFFIVCGMRKNLYVYSLYRNPDLDDRIFDCLLASMAAVQLRMSVPLSCLWVI